MEGSSGESRSGGGLGAEPGAYMLGASIVLLLVGILVLHLSKGKLSAGFFGVLLVFAAGFVACEGARLVFSPPPGASVLRHAMKGLFRG